MGRPKVALISRGIVLEVALRLIAERGLEALSIRAIANEIGVNSASLYHHFRNKDEIVNCAAELALKRTALPSLDSADKSWQALVSAGTFQLLQFLLEHPQLVPVFAQRRAVGLGDHFLERSLSHLLAAGMPLAIVSPLFEALEALSLGFVTRHISSQNSALNRREAGSFPLMQLAEERRILTGELAYTHGVKAIIEHFSNLVETRCDRLPDEVEIRTGFGRANHHSA